MQSSLNLKRLMGLVVLIGSMADGAGAAPWVSQDYIRLYFRIYNGLVPLPHLREPVQKALFEHLVAPENLSRIKSSGLSDDDQHDQLAMILASLGAYRSRYSYAIFMGEPLQQELALVQAYELDVLGCMARLKGERDVSHPSWITLISGVIDAVQEQGAGSSARNAVLVRAFAENYPVIAEVLSMSERNQVRAVVLKLGHAAGSSAEEQIRKSVVQ